VPVALHCFQSPDDERVSPHVTPEIANGQLAIFEIVGVRLTIQTRGVDVKLLTTKFSTLNPRQCVLTEEVEQRTREVEIVCYKPIC
jgi:hypothetical protein